MKLQYVFGNPTGKKKRSKKVAKKKKRTKRNPQKTRVTAYSKVKKKTKSGKTVTRKAKVQTRQGKTVASKGDLHRLRATLSETRAKIADAKAMKRQVKSRLAKKKLGQLVSKLQTAYKSANNKLKTKKAITSAEEKLINSLISDIKSAGMTATKKKTVWKGASVAKKKKRKKSKSVRRKRKRKSTKKASSKKVAKKATRKRKRRKSSSKKTKSVSRKRRSRKYSSKKRSVSLKKGQSVTVKANPKKRRTKRRKNPFFTTSVNRKGNPMIVGGMKIAGYEAIELAELGFGGLAYGAANSYITPLFNKIGLGQLSTLFGGTLPCLIAGIGANILSDKIKHAGAKKGLEFVGDGLLGAAIVGAGVHLSQTMLPASMSGVSYIPAMPGVDPDFSGVDYTPDGGYMSGVEFTPGMSLPGQNPSVDFGNLGKWNYEQDAADFGEVPEGLQGMN